VKPNFAAAYFDRARLFLTLNEVAKARADLEKSLQFSMDPRLQQAACEMLGQIATSAVRVRPGRRKR
jgi:hypothetical protein